MAGIYPIVHTKKPNNGVDDYMVNHLELVANCRKNTFTG